MIRGIDIGTGTACIYPLLGCALNPQWCFVASDVQLDAVELATANVCQPMCCRPMACMHVCTQNRKCAHTCTHARVCTRLHSWPKARL